MHHLSTIALYIPIHLLIVGIPNFSVSHHISLFFIPYTRIRLCSPGIPGCLYKNCRLKRRRETTTFKFNKKNQNRERKKTKFKEMYIYRNMYQEDIIWIRGCIRCCSRSRRCHSIANFLFSLLSFS